VRKVRADYPEGELTDIDGIRIDFPDWWFNLRVSNTEPLLRLVVEAATAEGLEKRKSELTEKIRLYTDSASRR
jgi:phosphomannomutase